MSKNSNVNNSSEICEILGKDVNKIKAIYKDTIKNKNEENLKGNLNNPSFIVKRPGKELHFPINLFSIPERKANYALAVLKPGGGWPVEFHDAIDDIYLILKGKGKVELNNKIFDAGSMDVFHIKSGTYHRLYNPEENIEDLHVWLVETPSTPLEAKAKEWGLLI